MLVVVEGPRVCGVTHRITRRTRAILFIFLVCVPVATYANKGRAAVAMTRGPTFVDGSAEDSKVGKPPTARRGTKEGEAAGAAAALPVTVPAAKGVSEFDVFEFLNEPASTELLRDPVLQRMTVVRYEGDINDDGFFHGKGTLVSTLGYTYSGELDRGLMHGQGEITWSNGISYSGGFQANVPHGVGKYCWTNGDWYEGEVSGAVRNGKGTFYYSALHSTYSGEWLSGARHGKGELKYSDVSRYIGEWHSDKKHGKGLMVYSSGDRYEGEWRLDKRHGTGVMVWTDKGNVVEVYKGDWSDGMQHGEGFSMYIRLPATSGPNSFPPSNTLGALGDVVPPRDSAINTYRGGHKNGLRHGFGTFVYDDGSRYEGMWRDHHKHGEGKSTTANGVVSIDNYEKGSIVQSEAATAAKAAATAAAVVAGDQTSQHEALAALSVEATAVPLFIRDVLGPSENNVPEAILSVQSVLLRHNGLLRRVFHLYANMVDAVAVFNTPATWRRDRTQGTMAIIQFMRLLSDARLLNRSMTIAEVGRMMTNLRDRNSPTADSATTGATPQAPTISFLQSKVDTPWKRYLNELHLLQGELTFRDFTEMMVRMAAVTYDDDAYGPLSHRVVIVAEDNLAPLLLPSPPTFPLCPNTRSHKEHIVPFTKLLQDLFLYYSANSMAGHSTQAGLPSQATTLSQPKSVAGVTLRVRQCLQMFKEGDVFSHDRFSIATALRVLFPYDKHPAFVASVHKKRLLQPSTQSLLLQQTQTQLSSTTTTSHNPQPPRGSVSDRASDMGSESATTTATAQTLSPPPLPAAQTGIPETVYRGRWLMTERSKGLGNCHLHSAVQPELELTFVEFVEAVVSAAMKKDTAQAPASRIRNFITTHLQPLHSMYC